MLSKSIFNVVAAAFRKYLLCFQSWVSLLRAAEKYCTRKPKDSSTKLIQDVYESSSSALIARFSF